MILDTNAVSALLSGDEALAVVLAPSERHHLPVIVIGEYRYGLLRSKYRQRLEPLLDILIRESIPLTVDLETTNHYSRVRDELRRIGTPIPENDVWIAALARQHAEPVVSRDEHFDAVNGVVRLCW